MNTIIEQIKAEIERLKATNPSEYNYQNAEGYVWALDDILSFISTLESEKPMQEGLEEEIKWYLEPIHVADIKFEPFTQMTRCARYFAKWGAEHLK